MGLDAVVRFEELGEQARREGKRVKAILLCSPNNPLGMSLFPSVQVTPAQYL